jgi:CelD/BcsL family acetyltransferase involved in cellulose biosynthesis
MDTNPSAACRETKAQLQPDGLTVTIEAGKPADPDRWDAVVASGTGNPVQFSDYRTVSFRWRKPLFVTVADRNGPLLCWLVHYVGPPLAGYIDIMAEPSHINPAAIHLAIQALTRRFRPVRFSFHNIVLSRFQDAAALSAIGWEVESGYGTYEVDLQASEEQLWSQLHKNHRNRIRRARKEGVSVIERNDEASIDEFLALLTQTLAGTGVGAPSRDHLHSCFSALGPRGRCRAFFAVQNDQTQAALVTLSSQQRGIAWLQATAPKRAEGSANLLHWDVLLALREQGVAVYDFGGVVLDPPAGSAAAGIAHFKELYGGRLVPCVSGAFVCSPLRDEASNAARRLVRWRDRLRLRE